MCDLGNEGANLERVAKSGKDERQKLNVCKWHLDGHGERGRKKEDIGTCVLTGGSLRNSAVGSRPPFHEPIIC